MSAILSALANGLVLSALLAGVVWLALRLLKRSFNAATRNAIWWIVLFATLAFPVFYLTAGNPRPIGSIGSENGPPEISAIPSVPSFSNPTSAIERPTASKHSWLPGIPFRLPASPWIPRFGELWALISLLLLARSAAGFAALHLQKKYAREAPPELRELLERCLMRLGIKRRVRVMLIREGNSPMLAGVLRPSVLIPERLLSELDSAEMEHIFLHEATHAARYDDWTLLLQRVIQAVFVFYPVVLWVARQINLEREAACDADVISATGDARAYAKCLTHVAELSLGEWKSPLAAAIADEKSYLTRRIHMLFDRKRHGGTRLLTLRLALAAAVVFLLAMLAATSPAFFVSAQSSGAAADRQKATGGRLSFEVASIKPVEKQARTLIGLDVYPGGRVVIPNVTLKGLIDTAFDLNWWQISGGENWTDSTLFNVEAKAPSNLAGRINLRHSWFHMEDPNLRLMLQSLLIDRFQLKLHTQTKTGTVYLLERNGKASPLQPAKTDSLFQHYGQGYSEVAPQGGAWYIVNGSMAQVANFISASIVHAPVLDKTGLTGTFDFRSKSQPDFSQDQQDSGASLLSGLDEMGLKLKQAKGPVEYFVIDYAHKPSPN